MDNFSFMMKKVVTPILRSLNTPKSLAALDLIVQGEWDQLATADIDLALYDNPHEFFLDYQAINLVRKLEDLPTSFDRKDAAIQAFQQAEKACCETNCRLDKYLYPSFLTDEKDIRILEVISKVRKNVKTILGPLPEDLVGRFGPGATVTDRAERATILHKLHAPPSITSHALPLLSLVEDTAWFRHVRMADKSGYYPNITDFNRFATVPKDAVKYRGIAMEPSLNIFLQLGVMDVMTVRLKRYGIDLSTAQDLHKVLAAQASKTDESATIDLSSASDMNALILLELFFEDDWAELLRMLRTPVTQIDGRPKRLHKISSQGNGFTFPLETIIFLALGVTSLQLVGIEPIVGENISVYGDDIIIAKEAARTMIALLRFFGHKPNTEKTFVDGPFRESCGGDYFLGHNVRPLFIKKVIDFEDPLEVFPLLNQLFHFACLHYGSLEASPYRKAWLNVYYNLPPILRMLKGPVALGDCVIHTAEPFCKLKNHSYDNYIDEFLGVKAIRKNVRHKRFSSEVQLCAALYGVPSEGIAPRGDPISWSVEWFGAKDDDVMVKPITKSQRRREQRIVDSQLEQSSAA